MARIYIDDDCSETITEIAWYYCCNTADHIKLDQSDNDLIKFSSLCHYIKDIPKIIRALEKAQELWGEK